MNLRKTQPHLTVHAPHTASVVSALLLAFTLAALAATHLAFTLPAPVKIGDPSHIGREFFSEEAAMVHVKALAEDIGTRVVGTSGEKRAEEYLLSKLSEIQRHSKVPFSIDVQRSSGSHSFTIMNTAVTKSYVNITNIVVHISCGRSECDENSILVNAHYDSQVGTVGACDDATPIAVMLELAQIISQKDTPFRNSLVLLFNGAEETLQDASHAFSTRHPLAKTVRSFINLEAMGNSGKEVLFQANSQSLVEAYGKSVRRPHGSVSSNDLFKTGLILSDTDYRQFLEYGGMLGIDMAIYQNSYLFEYHTMLDTAENIQPGLIQHLGENALDMVLHLMTEAEIETFKEGRDFIYFDLFDTLFFVYSTKTAALIHAIVISLSVFEIIRPGIWAASSPDSQRKSVRSLFAFIKTLVFVIANFVAALITPIFAGIFTQFVLGKPLMYFKEEWLAFLIFGPASLLGIFATHIFARLFVSTNVLDTPAAFERRVYAGNMLLSAGLILLMTWGGLGSTYISLIHLSSYLVALWLDRFISPPGNGVIGSHFPINPLSYFIASLLPLFNTVNSAWGFIMLFVPLTGRLGPETPSDAIVGGLVGLLVAMGASGIVSALLARCSHKWLLRGFLWSLVTIVVVLSVLVRSNEFDQLHPKRLFVQYGQNSTSGKESVLIGHADPVSVAGLVSSIAGSLGNVSHHRQSPEENDHSAAVFFPFSHFIEVYVIDFGVDSFKTIEGVKKDPVPTVKVEEVSDFDEGLEAREILVTCFHPDHLGIVLKFDAEVISWSLSTIPEAGFKTHVIKHAGGYPANFWNVTIKFKAASPTTKLYLHLSGIERNTYDTLEPYSKARQQMMGGGRGGGGKQKTLFRWLWGNGFRSGQVLKRVQGAISDYEKSVGGGAEWSTQGYMAVDQVTVIA